jgi:Ca-activated chloride channel family protein
LDDTRPTIAVFLSDGRPTVGLQDNFEVIQRFTDSNQGRISVFSVGVGRGVNRFLLDFLSFKNRGDARIFVDLGQAPSAIEAFVRELSRPVLIELSHRWSGVDDRDIYPKMLTHLYLDRPLTLHGRVPRSADRVGVRILGRSGRQQHDMVYGLNLSQGQAGGPDLRELWIRQRLTWLVGEHIRTRDPALRNEAWEWARRLGPSAPYAAELGFPQAPVRAD